MATLAGTYYAANATLRRAEPSTALDVSLNYGKIRYISDSYTVPTADEFGTSAVVNFFVIPKNSRVINMWLTAPVDGGSPATGQFNIGWLASEELDADGVALEALDADGFYVNTVADVGAGALARLAIAATRPGYRKKFAAAVQVQAACAEATLDYGDAVILLEAYLVVE